MGRPFLGSASALTRQRLRGRRLLRLHRDVYLEQPADVDQDTIDDAVLLTMPDAVLSCRSAARWWQLPVDPDGLVHVIRAPDAAVSRLRHVRTHRSPLPDRDRDRCRGRPVTTLARTFVDLAAELGPDDLVCVGDVVLRRAGRAQVEHAVRHAARRKGVARARDALPLLDPGSASPGETRLGLVLHRAGFVGLRTAVVVRDAGGQWLAEADLGDAPARVAVQYDGLVHFRGDVRQRVSDVARDELARCEGWEVVVLTARDLQQPQLAVRKVAAAYERAARRAAA